MTDEIQTYLDEGGAYSDLPLETRKEIEGDNMQKTQVIKREEKAPAFNIENLINQAVVANVPVESLERLLAMRKDLKVEWAKEQFDKSLAAFQGECPVVEKKKKVDFTGNSGTRTKYNYAPLEDIVEQVKPFLTKHGFSYMFDTETNGKMKVICKVKHIAGHSEVATFDMEIDTSAKMNVSQKYGSALTYAKRYAFCAAFAINVKDEDSDATSGESQNTQNSSPSGASGENSTKTTNDKCPVCMASGKYHRPDCPKKDQEAKAPVTEDIDPEHFCKIHNKPMKRREAQNGGFYFDHRWELEYGKGDWRKCNGLPKKQKENFDPYIDGDEESEEIVNSAAEALK